jgi:protein-L-isoaspartate(D-aspartate) O-methyltransferase
MKFADQRKLMVEQQLVARGITDERVLAAFAKVPREKFVPYELQHLAYQDAPLAIGGGQTISQPYIVAIMLQELHLQTQDITLEIGTGSGYQTALLAELTKQVYTIERVWKLINKAKKTLLEMGYENIYFRYGDGSLGWQEKNKTDMRFNKIVVAAAAPGVPPSLQQQLAKGGRLVIPIGSRFMQQLTVVTKQNGEIAEYSEDGCTFVPLIGKEGW